MLSVVKAHDELFLDPDKPFVLDLQTVNYILSALKVIAQCK